MQTFTLSQVVEMTGAPARVLRLWADAGAVQALPETEQAGRGHHRQFTWPEIEVAAILAKLAPYALPIGVMAEIGASLRGILRLGGLPDHLGGVARMGNAVQAARRGDRDVYLAVCPTTSQDTQPNRKFSLFVMDAPELPKLQGTGEARAAGLIVNLKVALEGLKRR